MRRDDLGGRRHRAGVLYPNEGEDAPAALGSARRRPTSTPIRRRAGAHVPAPVVHDGGRMDDDEELQALELGNVVLVYGEARHGRRRCARSADSVTGPFDPAAGGRRSGRSCSTQPAGDASGVIALAWRHELHAASANDPAAAEPFADFWLGRGVPA